MGERSDTALVLLPGLDGTGKLFEPLIAALPSDIHPRVVSFPTTEPLSLAEYAHLVLRALPTVRPTVLLAESFSGLVALTLLMQAHVQLRGVIFCASFAEPPRPFLLRFATLIRHAGILLRTTPAFMLRQFCLGPDAGAEQLTLLRHVLAHVSPTVLAHRLELIGARHPFLHTHFEIPCCYLQARNDRLVPSRSVRWFAEHFQHFELKEIDGPHFLLQAAPAECAAQIEKIMKQWP